MRVSLDHGSTLEPSSTPCATRASARLGAAWPCGVPKVVPDLCKRARSANVAHADACRASTPCHADSAVASDRRALALRIDVIGAAVLRTAGHRGDQPAVLVKWKRAIARVAAAFRRLDHEEARRPRCATSSALPVVAIGPWLMSRIRPTSRTKRHRRADAFGVGARTVSWTPRTPAHSALKPVVLTLARLLATTSMRRCSTRLRLQAEHEGVVHAALTLQSPVLPVVKCTLAWCRSRGIGGVCDVASGPGKLPGRQCAGGKFCRPVNQSLTTTA